MKYLLVIIVFLLFSCNKQNNTYNSIDISNPTTLDSAEVIYNFDDKYPISITIKDSLLYTICTNSDTCLYIIDLRTKNLMTSLGHIGYGPNDLINPNFILSTTHSKILLDVGSLKKIIRIDCQQKKFELKEDIPYPDSIFISSELNLSKNYIVGRKVNSEKGNMFFIYNRKNNHIFEADYFPSLTTDVKDKNYVYAPCLTMNETQNRIIAGMYFFDMFHIYDFSGNRINTFCFSEDYKPDIDDETGFLDLSNGYSGIVRTYPTENFCYLLRNTIIPEKGEVSMLIQIDWNGKLIHSYLFKDHVLGQFYVDEKYRKIYIIRNQIQPDDKEIFSIVAYSLKDYIK